MSGLDILILIVLAIAFLATVLFMPSWMVRRNMPKVVKIFRKRDAVGIRNAKTAVELGLQSKSLMQRLFSRRDYKPQALDFLIQAKVVLMTDDGKLYITDDSVASATWLKIKL